MGMQGWLVKTGRFRKEDLGRGIWPDRVLDSIVEIDEVYTMTNQAHPHADTCVITLYDTTLRDGTQGEGVSLSCDDKLRIARRLDEFGMDYIEGGWPGSNPKDMEFFERAQRELNLQTCHDRRLWLHLSGRC